MAAFVAKQMVGNKLSAVKGKVRYCELVVVTASFLLILMKCKCAEVPALSS